MTREDFLFIKSRLPKGYRETIKDSTRFSLCYIDKVMNGEKYNQKIVDVALAIFEDTVTAKNMAIEKYKRLVKESL